MDRTEKMLMAAIGIAIVPLVAACVAASPQVATTPLYTVRMEQASSEMNFLPTAVNDFTYTTEKGYTLGYDIAGCCGSLSSDTYQLTCDYYSTCQNTCPDTCPSTCAYSCGQTSCLTCPDTCILTCDTCEGRTCSEPTCRKTCKVSCGGSCWYTCDYTCESITCDISCEGHTCDS